MPRKSWNSSSCEVLTFSRLQNTLSGALTQMPKETVNVSQEFGNLDGGKNQSFPLTYNRNLLFSTGKNVENESKK